MLSKTVTILSCESIDKYHNWSLGRGKSLHTAKAYRSDLMVFLKALDTQTLQMEHFEDRAMYWLNQTRREAAPKTTNRRLTSLRGFAKWAGYPNALHDYIPPTPGKSVPHPLPEGIDGVVAMLEQAKSYQQKALIALCGLAGLRIHEAISVTVQDFDITIRDRITLAIRGKGDKTRVIPISNFAWGYIVYAYVLATSTPDNRVAPFPDRTARSTVTRLAEKAQLSRAVSSHDLRATFATAAYNLSLDQRAVQELLGHANGSTTEIYIGVSEEKMRNAVEF